MILLNNKFSNFSKQVHHYFQTEQLLNLQLFVLFEFYLYCQTGIYPCDNYFGLKATKMRSLESIIRQKLAKAEEKARKMREIYQERSRASQLLRKDPLDITIEDQKLLIRVIARYTKHRDKMNEEIERLTDVLEQATKAQTYFAGMTSEQREDYRNTASWQSDPHLQYIYGMGGLF